MITINYKLASIALQCAINESEVCGSNGLPITPSSIAMVGNFKSKIESINTQNNSNYLTQYLDCIRNKKEKITLIFEHYLNELPIDNFEKLAQNLLIALYNLHYIIGCVHGLITPEAFVFDGNDVKLTHWALNAISNCGQHCSAHMIIPNDIRFLPLEQLFGVTIVRKSDVWSLALSLLSLIESNINLPENPIEIVKSVDANEVLNKLNVNLNNLSEKWQNFFLSALHPKPTSRATVKQLMKILEIPIPEVEYQQLDTFLRFPKLDNTFKRDIITINEFYHLWCLSFPSRDNNEEKKQKKPPILTIPSLVLKEEINSNSETVLHKRYVSIPANNELKLLPIDKLIVRLNELPAHIFCPLILSPGFNCVWNSPNLPIVIRENDFDYQCERIMIFRRLIEGSPFVRTELLSCAKVDIPPLYRSHIWSSILNVKWTDLLLYEKIDKITWTPTDRQISVDIPRCHQYNDLLASPEGHQKLTRVLKAWLRHNEAKGDVYWQGLDSLAAPFVIINFNYESQAFACFNAFIHKYLKGFFQRDNSRVIQEYLALFSILIAFQDPILSNHLNSLSFVPDLYAIPWFLTMFTHVLPLHQILHLWDTLLLGNESFPLFIGLSVLHQLRDQLIEFTFNDCILIFSDLPQIDIDKCVKHAIKLFCATPKSVSQRGLWPLELLKSETVPRIDVSDVISLLKSQKTKVVIIDCRTKEQITKFGSIQKAIIDEEYDVITNGQIIVVVNDVQRAIELINANSVRVCLLQLNSYVPNELLA